MIARLASLLFVLAGCAEAPTSSGGAPSGSVAVSSLAASVRPPAPTAPTLSASEVKLSAQPSRVDASAAALDAVPAPRGPIAEFLVQASDTKTFAAKQVTLTGVFLRSTVHRWGNARDPNSEHIGGEAIVAYVGDAADAPATATVQCWTTGTAAPNLRPGQRVLLKGTVQHLVVSGPQPYLPYLASCELEP